MEESLPQTDLKNIFFNLGLILDQDILRITCSIYNNVLKADYIYNMLISFYACILDLSRLPNIIKSNVYAVSYGANPKCFVDTTIPSVFTLNALQIKYLQYDHTNGFPI